MEAGTSDRDAALRPWYRRKFTRRQRPLFGVPFLLGFVCAVVAYYTGWIALAVVGFGLIWVAVIVASRRGPPFPSRGQSHKEPSPASWPNRASRDDPFIRAARAAASSSERICS